MITISPERYHPIKVFSQERKRAPLRVAKELPSLTKPPLLWIFKSGFIDGLPWDPGEWHWHASSQRGDFPFFGYFARRGKETHQECEHLLPHSKVKPSEFHHHASCGQSWPQKVDILIRLTLNLATLHVDLPHRRPPNPFNIVFSSVPSPNGLGRPFIMSGKNGERPMTWLSFGRSSC